MLDQIKKNSTDTEKRLWFALRGKQLSGNKFRRQFPLLHYIVDFYCIEKKLAIELDGSQHMQHNEYDTKRTRELEKIGIRVLRFWDNEIFQNLPAVLEKILGELEASAKTSS